MTFDFDEVDIAMECMLDEKDEEQADSIIESDLTALEESNIIPSIFNTDTTDIVLDESDTDPIGMEAELIIETEQELLHGIGDESLVDISFLL